MPHNPPNGSKGFPAAWLEPIHDQFVMELPQWNHESPPADALEAEDFIVNWSQSCSAPCFKSGAAIGPTIVRLYFGLMGCIIPIADFLIAETPTMIFTIAGPVDAEGKKDFYVYVHNHSTLSAIQLYRLPPFPSVAEFYRNCFMEPWGTVCVQPVVGGEDAATKELIKCGFLSEAPSKPKKSKKRKDAVDWEAREKAGDVL
ncbi:hypothetical protein K438DRAFT_768856 [Mycena galopus ATCC 62051]|nr:hypothetical protein K438DRAFT_768856 [Mycena galopus ATCC 62051]